MPKFPIMRAKHWGGWTDWIFPAHSKNYQMKCCDCGLIHDIQFKAFVEHTRKRDTFKVQTLPWPFRVMFRARRAR